jgi:hypothetical protein
MEPCLLSRRLSFRRNDDIGSKSVRIIRVDRFVGDDQQAYYALKGVSRETGFTEKFARNIINGLVQDPESRILAAILRH